ncbi:hypothetical protein SAMN06295888_1642 [Desulfonatronum zhilinae]|nr:hypothetical protein SAMN06295888_1642 [Desulfonatronum zhilinae]
MSEDPTPNNRQLPGQIADEQTSPRSKADSSSGNARLTPSEIESLRQDSEATFQSLKGKFTHLFKNLK